METKKYNRKDLKSFRKDLRSHMTFEEILVWNMLRTYFKDQRFRKQYSVGNYILDFYSPRWKIAIEIDGAQHLNSEYDATRDAFIKSHSIQIIRFWNGDVKNNLKGVYLAILEVVSKVRS